MGLDHGLLKRHYVKNWDFMKPEERHEVIVLVGGQRSANIRADRIGYVEEEVITWRKSNQIHRWFVENVQDGKDDCGNYYVSQSKLEQLLKTCVEVVEASELVSGEVTTGYTYAAGSGETVALREAGQIINNPTVAKLLLPTQEGFFFGSTDYDQWYFEDLKRTMTVLQEELAKGDASDEYQYWSSW
jgi:hypothetical protein